MVASVSAVLVMVTTVWSKVGALRTVIVMLLSIVSAVLAVMYALIKTGSRTMFRVTKTSVTIRPEGHWSAPRSMFSSMGFVSAGGRPIRGQKRVRIISNI